MASVFEGSILDMEFYSLNIRFTAFDPVNLGLSEPIEALIKLTSFAFCSLKYSIGLSIVVKDDFITFPTHAL
jgi:hypothetical protein